MSLVYTKTPGGLVVAEHGTDAASVRDALRQYDRDLRLVRQYDDTNRCEVWKVYADRGPDRDALFVYAWQTDRGEPLPLSHRLVDAVKAQDRNSRAPKLDEDALNERRRAERERDWERDTEALAADWLFPHGRPVLHRSASLRMARDRRRARGEKV